MSENLFAKLRSSLSRNRRDSQNPVPLRSVLGIDLASPHQPPESVQVMYHKSPSMLQAASNFMPSPLTAAEKAALDAQMQMGMQLQQQQQGSMWHQLALYHQQRLEQEILRQMQMLQAWSPPVMGLPPGPRYKTADLPEEKQLGEIVAWRAWDFKDGYLRSPYRSSVKWLAGETAAADADPFDSDGGFYAHKTAERLFSEEGTLGQTPGPIAVHGYDVAGTVLLWGNVVEHEHGYRAQYARVGKLLHFKPDMSESFIRWLKSEFDMPE